MMKQVLSIIVILILSAFSLHSQQFEDLQENNLEFKQIQEVFQNELIGDANTDTLKGWKQFKRWEYQTKREVDENGHLKNSEEKFKFIKYEIKFEIIFLTLLFSFYY